MMLMMRHHGDDVYMTSQPIAVKIETSLFYRIDNDLGRIFDCFRDMASFPLKNAHFSTPSIQPQILKCSPCTRSLKFCVLKFKTRANYSCKVFACHLTFSHNMSVTDGQTDDDRWTEGRQPCHKLDRYLSVVS